jgi:hypothetical protein
MAQEIGKARPVEFGENDPDRTSVSATSLVRRDPEDEQVGGQGLIVRDNIAFQGR